MFEGITPVHLVLVLAVVLLVLGPGKLPEVGAALGRGIREFRGAVGGADEPTAPSASRASEPGTTSPAAATVPTEGDAGQR